MTGQPVKVEVELDLSLKLQLLDVALIRLKGKLGIEMPDGFDDLGAHNLITFKSFQETLDEWALEELLSYWVDYRKQAGPDMRDLPALDQFRRYAVCARFPQ
ncbi:MAG: hypothetical protein K2W96_12910, partial [Gemmataceae bacterium]|nr:hypothetical protein [Gemmataceae bacterium]